jgi:hypothetical protein
MEVTRRCRTHRSTHDGIDMKTRSIGKLSTSVVGLGCNNLTLAPDDLAEIDRITLGDPL